MIKKLYLKFKSFDRRIKFLMVGGLNTIVGVGTETLIYVLCGVPFSLTNHQDTAIWIIVLASVIAQTVGTLHSYVWNKFFTFESKSKSKKELLRFISVYVAAFFVSIGLKYLLNNVLEVNIYIATLIALAVTTVMSYVGHNLFSFRQDKKSQAADTKVPPENEALDDHTEKSSFGQKDEKD